MNQLYELPHHPDAALEAILDRYGGVDRRSDATLRERLLPDVEELLADELVEPGVTARIDRAHAVAVRRELVDVHGPLGLYLALDAATRASLSTSEKLRKEARRRFAGAAMLECFRGYYEISDDYDLERARLYEVGTTSLIVKCRRATQGPAVPENIALKCVLPRFLSVKAIRTRTAAYKDEHMCDDEALPYAPHIFESTERTIAMQLVAGDTLARRLEERDRESRREGGAGRALTHDDIEFLRKVGVAICRGLDALAYINRRHLDLSPSNIIIERETETELEIRFIDFGHNFALTDRAGSSSTFQRASLYVAPELIEKDPTIDNWRCDAYSLGVILLAIAAKREIHAEDVAGELDRLWKGDGAGWDGVPGLARVIEELIDHDCDQRLALWSDDATSPPYRYIEGLVEQECEVLKLYEAKTHGAGFGLLHGRALVLVWRNAQVANLLETQRTIKAPVDETYVDYPRLAWWGGLALFCWGATITIGLTLTLFSLQLIDPEPWMRTLADVHSEHFRFKEFWPDLWGRLVAGTFALTAVTYYVNCLSTLSPKRLNARIGLLSEYVMRGIPVALAVPIVATMFRPDIWALTAGIGTMLVVANNFVALCIARQADRVGTRFSTRTAQGNRFITAEYSQWWSQMLGYSIALLLIGALIATDVAQDAVIFAMLTVATNIWKVYRLNCIAKAPELRGSLARDILTLRRHDALAARGVLPPQGEKAQQPDTDAPQWVKDQRVWWWDRPAPRGTHPAPAREIDPEPGES